MSNRIGMRFSRIAGTAAGLGRTASGRTLIADRPTDRAGGLGLGMNGAELLAASLGGCFWNDLHYAAAAAGVVLEVDAVDADVELAGNPARVVRAHIRARLSGNDEGLLQEVFDAATGDSTIANSLKPAIGITFERQTGDRT